MNNELIGAFIKELRESKKMSQTELAQHIHLSRTVVNKIEHGKAGITSQNLLSIAELFNVSTDEILAGKFKDNENDKEIEDAKLKMVDKYLLLTKRLKLFGKILVFFILLFLIYFFVTFYSSVRMYDVEINDDDFIIKDGLIFKTMDKICLRFETDFLNENVKLFNVYYELDGKKYYIFKTDDTAVNVTINDYYDLQEYFDFTKFNIIKDNIRFELVYKDDSIRAIKPKMTKNYINTKVFFTKSKFNYKEINNEKPKLDVLIENIVNKYKDENYIFIYNKKEYNVFVNESIIKIYDSNNTEYILCYRDNVFKYYDNNDISYKYDIKNNKCLEEKCETFEEDYDLFINILNELIKK